MKGMQNIINGLANIQDTTKVLTALSVAYERSMKTESGGKHMKENMDSWSDETKMNKIKVLCSKLEEQSSLNKLLILIIINYVFTGDFSMDLSKTAMKFGANPEDILSDMIKKKMGYK